MTYGKEKALNMGRSLLPSTARKMARKDKAHHKRLSRHVIRAELAQLRDDPEHFDESSVDYNEYPDREINSARNSRRGADKIGPFSRWAEAITKNVDQDSRLTYVKSLLPKNVIGDHALTHIEWKDHFASRAEIQLEKNKDLNREDEYRKKQNKNKRISHDEQLELLYKVIENSYLHRELNKFVDAHSHSATPTESNYVRFFNEKTGKWEYKYETTYLSYPPGTKRKPKRKLLGSHDIESFINDHARGSRLPNVIVIEGKRYANPEYVATCYDAVCTFLRAVVRDGERIPRKIDSYYYY